MWEPYNVDLLYHKCDQSKSMIPSTEKDRKDSAISDLQGKLNGKSQKWPEQINACIWLYEVQCKKMMSSWITLRHWFTAYILFWYIYIYIYLSKTFRGWRFGHGQNFGLNWYERVLVITRLYYFKPHIYQRFVLNVVHKIYAIGAMMIGTSKLPRSKLNELWIIMITIPQKCILKRTNQKSNSRMKGQIWRSKWNNKIEVWDMWLTAWAC